MKKGLLLIFILGLFFQANAQNVVWSDDFSNGFKGWTFNSIKCGTFSDGLVGEWTLINATVNGVELSGINGFLSVGTNETYQATFNSASDQLYVQGRYSLDNGNFVSNLNGETLDFAGNTVKTESGETITLYMANLSTTQGAFDNLQAALGIGSPSYSISTGQTLTITLGNNSFEYQKNNDCGGLWEWSQIGYVGNGALIPNNFDGRSTSPTASNGVAVINADFLTTQGNPANLPDELPYPPYFTELITPSIDLSGSDDSYSISFYQLLRKLNVDDDAPIDPAVGSRIFTSFSYSIDGGDTWSRAFNTSPQASIFDIYANIDIFPLPTEVNGQSDVKIKFTWAGDLYFWMLDDIQIFTRASLDMKVNENFLSVYPVRVAPLSQIADVYFIADIQNDGTATAEDVQLNLSIENVVFEEEVYNSTIEYGDLTSDSLAQNQIFPEPITSANISTFGAFVGTYEVSLNGEDQLPVNDTSSFDFFVLDTLFWKENGDELRSASPVEDRSYTYGNVFYVPNGDGYYARTISFAVINPEELVGSNVAILLYEWEGDTNGDFAANPEEYNNIPIAFNSYVFDGSEVGRFITVPVSDQGEGVPLKDDHYYIPAVQYFTETNQRCILFGSGANNFNATIAVGDSLGKPRYASALEVGQPDEINLSLAAFGPDLVPLIRMSIGDNPDLSQPAIIMPTNTEEELPLDNVVSIYPNPVSDYLQLEFELTEITDKIQVTIYDQSGKALIMRGYDKQQQGQLSYDLSLLPAGAYYLKFTTDQGSRTKKFIIER